MIQTKLLWEIFIMNNIKVNPTPPLYSTKSSTSGYSNNGSAKGGNKDNYSGPSFQDIFKRTLEKRS
jgi:hypothetical protein